MSYADLSENQSIAMLLLNLMCAPIGFLVGSCSDKQGCNKRLLGYAVIGFIILAVRSSALSNAAACFPNDRYVHYRTREEYDRAKAIQWECASGPTWAFFGAIFVFFIYWIASVKYSYNQLQYTRKQGSTWA